MKDKTERVGNEEIYSLITGEEVSWKAIIYDLIKSEQLDPLDINIAILTRNFLGKIRNLEEANFHISGKVLLAASILLKMKAERVYNQLNYIDELLFGKEAEEEDEVESYFIDNDKLPQIVPKTPLPRMKKVTLQDLMNALGKAIEVEGRREKRYKAIKEAEEEAAIVLPIKAINISVLIKDVFSKITNLFSKNKKEEITFSELLPSEKREDKIATFVPLLHLDTREEITINQPQAFKEIFIRIFKRFTPDSSRED